MIFDLQKMCVALHRGIAQESRRTLTDLLLYEKFSNPTFSFSKQVT